MSTKQFAAQMRVMIEDIKSKGTAAIYCDNLISYLQEVENAPQAEPASIEIEQYKAKLQSQIESNKHQHESNLAMFKSVIDAGQGAIKSSFLLNGGAAVALLAFIGHLAQVSPTKVPQFATCLLPFALGVLAISITSGFTYLSQWLYAQNSQRKQKFGYFFNLSCILIGLFSYGFFAWGLLTTYRLFRLYA